MKEEADLPAAAEAAAEWLSKRMNTAWPGRSSLRADRLVYLKEEKGPAFAAIDLTGLTAPFGKSYVEWRPRIDLQWRRVGSLVEAVTALFQARPDLQRNIMELIALEVEDDPNSTLE